jgi:hypothetical protein
MAFPGNWTLFYDWDCDGTYSTAPMTINNDGTFAVEGYSGQWVESAGMIEFKFNAPSTTTYAGNLASKSVTGISATFEGLNGCFYMLQEGVPTTFVAERAARKGMDVSGKDFKES